VSLEHLVRSLESCKEVVGWCTAWWKNISDACWLSGLVHSWCLFVPLGVLLVNTPSWTL